MELMPTSHNVHYADLRIMPTWLVELLVGAVLAA
jgi:hypothetical protein